MRITYVGTREDFINAQQTHLWRRYSPAAARLQKILAPLSGFGFLYLALHMYRKHDNLFLVVVEFICGHIDADSAANGMKQPLPFSNDAIDCVCPGRSSGTLQWSVVKGVVESPTSVLLYTATGLTLAIPTRLLSEAQTEELRTILREKGVASSKKVVENIEQIPHRSRYPHPHNPMRLLSASEAISPAIERTRTVLFRRFMPGRSWKLAATAYLSAMGAFFIPTPLFTFGAALSQPHANLFALLFSGILGILISVLMFGFFYIGARLEFVLFDIVLLNEKFVAPSWRRHAQHSWRWVGFKLCFSLAAGIVCGPLFFVAFRYLLPRVAAASARSGPAALA